MLLSVIIVSYNTKDLTLQTVDSVADSVKNSKLLKNKLEIIVVDNNSHDDTVSELKKIKKTLSIPVTIIENKTNAGFAKANNAGVAVAQGEYILFLNSDTIVQEGALENMVQRFLDDATESDEDIQELGILSPVLLNTDLTYQAQGGSRPNLFTLFVHMCFLDDLPLIGKLLPSTQHTGKANTLTLRYLDTETELIPQDWVAGTALMTSKQVLDTIGLLDQNIFMYGEDTELCMRAQNHHYRVAIDPTARIIHLQSASSSSENAIRGEFKGYQYIFAKHAPSFQATLARIILQLGALLRIFLFSYIAVNKQKAAIYKSVLSDLELEK